VQSRLHSITFLTTQGARRDVCCSPVFSNTLINGAGGFHQASSSLYSQGIRRRGSIALQCTRVVLQSLWFVLFFFLSLQAQQPSANPGNPGSAPSEHVNNASSSTRTPSRFFGYASNKSLIFPDIATSPGPLTAQGKFKLFVNQSISPPYVLAAGLSAAFNQARDVPPGYGQGWDAYGSRFGAEMARASSSSFFGTFLFATVLHQDPRFFPESEPTMWRTMKYSAQLIVITRNDSGKLVFNSSGLLGPLASESLANVYLPPSEQTIGKTATRFAVVLAWRFAGNMFKNYWPTMFHNMGLNRLRVIPDPGTPARPNQEN
jgi:hypothetical protein